MLSDELIRVRFWAKVLKLPGEDNCWPWIGSKGTKSHYGNLHLGFDDAGKRIVKAAHVISWYLEHGIWSNLCILHTCDHPWCVRPKHLWEGTHQENMQDMLDKQRHYSLTKVSSAQVEYARDMRGILTQKDLATQLGVVPQTISKIQLGKIHVVPS